MRALSFLLVVFVCGQLFAQNPIVEFKTSYDTLVLTTNNKSVGLSSHKGIKIVPPAYDMVFPTLSPDLSFIIKKRKMGLYDNTAQKEVLLTSAAEIELLPGTDHLRFVNLWGYVDGSYQLQKAWKIARNVKGKLEYDENPDAQTMPAGFEFYKDGIRLLSDTIVIYHRAKVSFETTDEDEWGGFGETTYYLVDSIQQSGVFSLNSKRFVVPPKYATIKTPGSGNANPTSHYYEVTSIQEVIDSFYGTVDLTEDDYKNKSHIGHDLYQKYDYSQSRGTLRDIKTVSMPNDWYFNKVAGAIDVFNERHSNIFHLPMKGSPKTAFVVNDYIYIGFHNYYELFPNVSPYTTGEEEENWDWDEECDEDAEYQSEIVEYAVYNRKGELVAEQLKLNIEYVENGSRVFAGELDQSDCATVYWGIYDLASLQFEKEPTYMEVNIKAYPADAYCDASQCDHFYEVMKSDSSLVYFNQDFEVIEF